MKCLRIMLCFKYCYKELFAMIHPRAVTHIKIGGKTVPEDVVRSVLGFLALYMALFALSTVLLAGTGVDFITALRRRGRHHRQYRPGFRDGGAGR
jgi:trk system potassium uptake protein TrkH